MSSISVAGVSIEIIKQIHKLDKKLDMHRVLDVGANFGMWAMLLRRPEQFWVALDEDIRKVEQYHLKDNYNRVYISDARITNYDLIGGWWDLAIITNILKHLNEEEAMNLITELLPRAKHLLIIVPVNEAEWMDKFIGTFIATHTILKRDDNSQSAHFLIETL